MGLELNWKKELVGRHGLFRKPSTRKGKKKNFKVVLVYAVIVPLMIN